MDPGAGLRHDRLRSQGCNCLPHFREVEDPGELVECRFCFTKFGVDCCLSAVGGKSEGPYGTYYTCHRCAYKYEDPKCIKVVTTFDENSAQVGDPAETDANLEECCVWAEENSNADLKASTCPMLPEMSWYWDTDASCCV